MPKPKKQKIDTSWAPYLGGAIGIFVLVVILVELFKRTRQEHAIQAVEKAFGKLDSVQIDSIRRITDAWNRYGDGDTNKFAYVLATARHETNFRPIKEIKAKASQADVYALQSRYWDSGYYGRGFIGLTREGNYKKMSSYVGVDLVKNPDLALQPDIAAKILVTFMMNKIGKYSLHDFINKDQVDYYNARKVVNILDRADLIKGYAIKIRENL